MREEKMQAEEQTNPSEEEAVLKKEVPMEEMFDALYGGLKGGAGLVLGGVSQFARYSWLGMKYAGSDLKEVSGMVVEKGSTLLRSKEKKTAEVT